MKFFKFALLAILIMPAFSPTIQAQDENNLEVCTIQSSSASNSAEIDEILEDVVAMEDDPAEKTKLSFKDLKKEVIYQIFYNYISMAILYQKIGEWKKHEMDLKSVLKRWNQNISTTYWDTDNFSTNYLCHPYAGSVYYNAARQKGFSMRDSFLYSLFASTILWEYSFEAIAEIPSQQDLWATPVIGSLIGEFTYRLDKRIKDKKWAKKPFGKILRYLINPIGRTIYGVEKLTKELTGKNFEFKFAPHKVGPSSIPTQQGMRPEYINSIGIEVKF